MFFLHGQTFTLDQIEMFTESLIETYEYETPETILLFLGKAAKGDFGKFFGAINIGTLREWFADFLQQEIIPARERLHTAPSVGTGERNRATPGIQPIQTILTKVTKETDFEAGKKRDL